MCLSIVNLSLGWNKKFYCCDNVENWTHFFVLHSFVGVNSTSITSMNISKESFTHWASKELPPCQTHTTHANSTSAENHSNFHNRFFTVAIF